MVSLAYFIWPLTLYARVEPRPDASAWYHFHLRQALWFGVLCGAVSFVALAWPLAASLIVGNVIGVLWIYAAAFLIDVALFVLWLTLAIRYSQRAARGEFFEIPWVARFTGTRISK